jgi:diguanylate cyclase (GGDEF)-like protein
VVRWGAEEFLVVARFVDRQRGPELAEKVRAEIAATAFALPGGEALRRTCSLGFAAFPFAPADPQAVGWGRVVHAADLCLYVAKRRGRDGWVGVALTGERDAAVALAELERDPEASAGSGALALVSSRDW